MLYLSCSFLRDRLDREDAWGQAELRGFVAQDYSKPDADPQSDFIEGSLHLHLSI